MNDSVTAAAEAVADPYTEGYFERAEGSNYVGYGDDPGWPTTVETLTTLLGIPTFAVEVGCAKGWFVHHALRAGWTAAGTDLSTYATSHPAPGVRSALQRAVAHSQPFQTGTVDLLCSWEMLEHVPTSDLSKTFAEWRRISKPGAVWVHRIALADAAHDHHADDDHTHVTMEDRGWWHSWFEAFGGMRLSSVEHALDEAFVGRDWQGRFFAYQMP